MAPTARIAQKIGGRTIHSTMKLAWGNGSVLDELEKKLTKMQDSPDYIPLCLRESQSLEMDPRDMSGVEVVVIDEIGMVPFWLTYQIVRYFFTAVRRPVLVILMGDKNQLKPVHAQYNVFHVSFAEFESVSLDLTESMRFEPEYLSVVERLRDLMDNEEELFAYVKKTFPVVDEISGDILSRCTRVLVYKNATADLYNRYFLNRMPGRAIKLYRVLHDKVVGDAFVRVKPGCPVYLVENGCCLHTNGTLLQFERYDREKDVAVCTYGWGEKVNVYRSQYTGNMPLVVGFAGTVHKYQGETIDESNIVFNFDQCKDLNLVYTALSRVRSLRQILAVQF